METGAYLYMYEYVYVHMDMCAPMWCAHMHMYICMWYIRTWDACVRIHASRACWHTYVWERSIAVCMCIINVCMYVCMYLFVLGLWWLFRYYHRNLYIYMYIFIYKYTYIWPHAPAGMHVHIYECMHDIVSYTYIYIKLGSIKLSSSENLGNETTNSFLPHSAIH